NFDEPSQPTRINPRDCRGCHSQEQRPNFEPYSVWPGAYGSLHDRILPNTLEHTEARAFAAYAKTHPRYQYLRQFLVDIEGVVSESTLYFVNRGVSLNAYFGILQSNFMRHRMARSMALSRDHDQYRYAITAALVGCEEEPRSYIPDQFLDNHTQTFE